jgi:hypothetical protein
VSDLALYGPLGFAKTKRQLGRSDLLQLPTQALDPKAKQEVSLIFAAAQNVDELGVGDALAQQVVITCSVSYPRNNPAATRSCNVRGKLSWGGDGHSYQVEFDWRQGTVLRPVGSSFELSAFLANDGAGNAPNCSADVGAWIGYGAPNGMWNATHTDRVAVASASLDIPFLATDLCVFPSVGEDAVVTLDWFAGAQLLGRSIVAQGARVPVPGLGATRVVVAAGDDTPLLVTWNLGV